MSKIKRNNKEICIYCGIPLSAINKTKDHIPPKCLFTNEERKSFQAITVPSCKKCNNGSSGRDENVKYLLNMAVVQMQKDTPNQILHLRNTLEKNNRLRKPLRKVKQKLCQDTITGIYTIEQLIAVNSEIRADAQHVFARIARGLIWHHFNKTLFCTEFNVIFPYGVDLFASASQDDAIKAKKLKIILDLCSNSKRYNLIPKVFTYWVGKAMGSEEGFYSIFLYREAVAIIVI